MKQNTKRIPAKGTSRRVVIVPGEDGSMFEQIIYIVKDDCLSEKGVSVEHVLREAIQSLQSESAERDSRVSSASFTRVLVVLISIAFLLTAAILICLYHGGM